MSRSLSWASLIVLLCLLATPAVAATYTDNGDGTVTDSTTGLTWMRCAMGQTWTGSTCSGTASASYTWAQATALTGTVSFAGKSDWRVPNIRELLTLIDRSKFSPAIDAAAFPSAPAAHFWSGSPSVAFPDGAWVVGFSYGNAGGGGLRSDGHSVRLVRGGQSSGLLDIARPTSDYVDHGDGTVTHAPTGLMWKRCAEGQSWTGSVCTGTASTYTWDVAKVLTGTYAGKNDWRIPTEDELATLMDYTHSAPAINTTVFPDTLTSSFWSASAHAGDSSRAWDVDFYNGFFVDTDKNTTYQVRLVRTGQSSGSTSSTTTTTTTGSTTTTTASTTTTTQGGGAGAVTVNLVAGWNLLGNGGTAAIDVSAFNDTSKIMTVWKWIANGAKWAFYAPSLAGQALTDYATSKGYDVLSTVNGGEGFWVNARIEFSVQRSSSSAVTSASFQSMVSGWNLIAVGDSPTPSAFNKTLSVTPPAAGDIPLNLTTLWAWDAALTNWYFYAPSLEKNGGLLNYIQSKNYLDFGTKALTPTTGFWVNKP